ncbi:WYL domain-containing transcriptional regulator [Alkalimarinus alittae]|uniref:WYL domain-containing protein n=1 Tax=Alkalimarinus alittae TaxID=2961619 RepID=A0ABY6N563_9ALTE|nr:WYL domain-containing protein [Alkalimarinus alittae]UZE97231.1 WYL domain-containing protein [Alkalimarinus alittae]
MQLNLTEERQQQRLNYIDLCALVLGCVSRKLLMNRFDIKEATASKDIKTYQERSGERLKYSHQLRAYTPVDWFSPLFEHSVEHALDLIGKGSLSVTCDPSIADNIYTQRLQSSLPVLANISSIFRALYLRKKVEIAYISQTSGESTRLIAPHSLIATGTSTYVRAFDHKSGEFRSFKLNRVVHSKLTNYLPEPKQEKSFDSEWNEHVTLKITPNHKLEHPESVELDYKMANGVLTINIKKALVKFFLMDWHIAPLEFPDLPGVLFPLKLESITPVIEIT